MAQQPNISKRPSGKPSKIIMSVALVIAFSLPYILVKNFAHQEKSVDESHVTIALPQIADAPTAAIQESSITPVSVKKIEPTIKAQPVKALPVAKPETSKTAPKAVVAKSKDNQWQIIKPRPGDSMAIIFHRLGLSAKNLHEVLDKNPHSKALTAIKPNQQLQFLINKNVLEKLIIPVNSIQSLTVYKAGSVYKTQIDSKKTNTQNHYITATVNGSLYLTAQKLNIPAKLIRQMTQILSREIDFAKSIRSGDQFSIIYDAYYVEDKMVGTGGIVAVTYTNKGKTYRAIRHTSANGGHDYFTPEGNSLKKAFTRYPIRFSHISSTFSASRNHPILHYKRAHKGIDLAAPIGTPITATGDGVITIIDRHNGYGNMIKIKHDKTYSSVYGHMLKFQKGLSKGSKVKRGQVIGYVGQTGLATGPHCHYELHVNNEARNPTTTGLPTAAPVSSREMASFKAKTNTLLARLKLFEQAHIASKGKKTHHVG